MRIVLKLKGKLGLQTLARLRTCVSSLGRAKATCLALMKSCCLSQMPTKPSPQKHEGSADGQSIISTIGSSLVMMTLTSSLKGYATPDLSVTITWDAFAGLPE